MPRQAVNFHTDDVKIEQKPDLADDDLEDREPEIIRAEQDALLKKDYLNELAFNEEPVTIRLEPSTDKNAAMVFPIWNNGKGCEILVNGKWREAPNGFIPVNQELTIKRKYLAILVGAKIDTVDTQVIENPGEDPRNNVKRFTSPVHSFSVIEDKNPRGHAWLTELRRRNL
jgi:hypothetical protein